MYAGYEYQKNHIWRNVRNHIARRHAPRSRQFGILIGFWAFFMFLQMLFVRRRAGP